MSKKDEGYLGNLLLKKQNYDIEWTPELVTEYVKCANDPLYFVETYMKIININNGLVPFILYPYQKQMLLAMAENRFSIFATARQSGKSSITCAFILWYIIFHADKTIALLANKGETAREILGKVQLAYQHLPKWLQQGVKEWNKGNMVLENNS
ncbi:MAG: terminase large subunit domain-containing protein, partial [Candidatus Bathyarchaeia archaeon]